MKNLFVRLNPNRVANLSPSAWLIMGLGLAGLIVAEFFVHHHGHFGVDDSFGFFAWYGFAASAGLVILGNLLSKVLKRPESYYQSENQDDD
jgi:uncharacterized membrane protein YjjB (DUF3815 family)